MNITLVMQQRRARPCAIRGRQAALQHGDLQPTLYSADSIPLQHFLSTYSFSILTQAQSVCFVNFQLSFMFSHHKSRALAVLFVLLGA